MMKSTILCIGHPENPNIQALGKQVKALDKEARMVIFQPGLDGHFIEISGGNKTEFSCVLVVNGERIPGKSITSVLYYLKPIAQADNLKGLIAQEFIDNEWDEVISSLESYLSHAQWMNPLNGSFLRDCKPYQQRLAQEVGLTVPRTTITNDVAAVEKALDEGRIIFKAMSPLFTSEGQVFVPTEMTSESLSLYRTGIAKCPAIFQQFVKKRSNLRVYVVGCTVSAVRIAAQAPKKQEDLKPIYSATQISESLKERILEFHKRAGLVYGAYDFLESGDDVFFMDCQPLGSWICLERFAGLKTTELIAQYLLGRDETCLEFSASVAEK